MPKFIEAQLDQIWASMGIDRPDNTEKIARWIQRDMAGSMSGGTSEDIRIGLRRLIETLVCEEWAVTQRWPRDINGVLTQWDEIGRFQSYDEARTFLFAHLAEQKGNTKKHITYSKSGDFWKFDGCEYHINEVL